MRESTEEYRKRVIRVSDERDEFYQDVDGYIYWWPEGSESGHMGSHHLRWIADELDRRNKEWDTKVSRDLRRMTWRRKWDRFIDLALANPWFWVVGFWILAFAIAYLTHQ